MKADLEKDLKYWQEEHCYCSQRADEAFKTGDVDGANTWLNEITECENQIARLQKEIESCGS